MVTAMVRTSMTLSGVGASVLEDGANDGGDNDGGPPRCRCQCQQIQIQNTNSNTNSPQA